MLLEIESVEPGALDPAVLPKSAQPEATKSAAVQGSPSAEAEIDALLNAPPVQAEASPTAEAAAPAETAATDAATAEQAGMLAALNSALQGLNDEPPTDAPAPASAEAAASPQSVPAEESLSMEDKLQAEIAALMNAEPQAATAAEAEASLQAATDVEPDDMDALEGSFESPESLGVASSAAATSADPTSTTEDLIAQEIEGLLNISQDEPAAQASADTAIDELDKMLAQEIDADDDLAGDFQSVEDLTAGIQVPDTAANDIDDAHAATARDVAAELDSQPEDLPDASFEPVTGPAGPDEDPFAVLDQLATTAEKNEQAHEVSVARQAPDWAHWLEVGREKLLSTCYLVNWPARRFLNNEWRATLGLISLTFACTSSIFLLFVLILG